MIQFESNIPTLNLNSSLLEIKTPKGEIAIDIQALLGADTNSPSAYFNATQISKLFGKTYYDVSRGKEFKTHLRLLQDELNLVENVEIHHYAKMRNGDKAPNLGLSLNDIYNDEGKLKAVIIKKGGNQNKAKGSFTLSGTWVHHDLAILVIRKLNYEWGFAMDRLLKQLLIKAKSLKDNRVKTVTNYHSLQNALNDIFMPHQREERYRGEHYVRIYNMINELVIGTTSKSYKRLHNLSKDDLIRDYFTDEQLQYVEELELYLAVSIKMRYIIDFRGIYNCLISHKGGKEDYYEYMSFLKFMEL